MPLLRILRTRSLLNAAENRSSIPFLTRFYAAKSGDGEKLNPWAVTARNNLAKAALQEHLHLTIDLTFQEAETLAYNSPIFVQNLLANIDDKEKDVGKALRRYFRYHPINEFEPFFESLGLKPAEYAPLLPRGMMCLRDDPLLMENYHTLCNYGVPSNKIGKIYLEAREVFRYDYGVLRTKLVGYEKLGFTRSTLSKLAVSSPTLLIGGIHLDFVKVLDKLKGLGFAFGWLDGQLSESSSYNWGRILELSCLFSKIVSSEEELGELINQHPGLLFHCSGDWTLLLIGLLLKFGCTVNQIHSLLLQFPQIHVEKFVSNLKSSFLFLTSIGMESEEIVKLVRSHPLVLGSCQLRSSAKLMHCLKVSKQQLRNYIKNNPLELKNWGLGSKPKPLPKQEEEIMEERQKAKFMSDMEFDESLFPRKGTFSNVSFRDLQERFDVFVKAGLDRKDVSRLVRKNPGLLTMSKDVTQRKIDYLVNVLGCPVSTVLKFPVYIRLSNQRVRLRMEMYKWLKEEEVVNRELAVSTILGSSDKEFISWYVNHHPRGREVWEDLKKKIYSE